MRRTCSWLTKKALLINKATPTESTNPLTKPSSIDASSLHVVSLPIGNLKDFSLRAMEVLSKVECIVSTNREATKLLLSLVKIEHSGRLIHYRKDGNAQIVDLLKSGRSVALVTTSGTPCVGDDGVELVREMLSSGVRVTSVPGPSSPVAALSISGLGVPDGSFYFGG